MYASFKIWSLIVVENVEDLEKHLPSKLVRGMTIKRHLVAMRYMWSQFSGAIIIIPLYGKRHFWVLVGFLFCHDVWVSRALVKGNLLRELNYKETRTVSWWNIYFKSVAIAILTSKA